ncbi:MAG: DUF1778 domain-containing protein [Sterolibacteriaceae bacterium]|nr:DUF1778 domain-containing protein [Sterolibacteriaceae bacterium]
MNDSFLQAELRLPAKRRRKTYPIGCDDVTECVRMRLSRSRPRDTIVRNISVQERIVMSTNTQAHERIDLRTSPEIKDLIVRAASSAGMTVSAFLLGTAQEREGDPCRKGDGDAHVSRLEGFCQGAGQHREAAAQARRRHEASP